VCFGNKSDFDLDFNPCLYAIPVGKLLTLILFWKFFNSENSDSDKKFFNPENPDSDKRYSKKSLFKNVKA